MVLIVRRGAVAVYDGNFVVDNVEDGFDFYRLDNCGFIQSYRTCLDAMRQPKQVEFVEQGGAIVGGSDHGKAYVFDVRSGSQLDILHHRKHVMVQTVAVHLQPFEGTRKTLTCS